MYLLLFLKYLLDHVCACVKRERHRACVHVHLEKGARSVRFGPKKMLTRSYLFLGLLWSFLLYAKATSVCVARLHSGDVFVNEGGAIATCAEYGATCALGSELDGEGGADSDGLQCGCDVSEVLVPCPACKCSTIYPVFNGTSCK